jgi:DNA-binding NarL/FixJ family response regulator
VYEVVRRAHLLEGVRVVVVVDQVSRDELVGLLTAGAHAVLSRSADAAEIASALRQVSKGERSLGPALLSLLVGAVEMEGIDGDGLLTPKEREVLTRLARGRSNREIAEELFVTAATVKTHLGHIYVKLGVTGRQEAIARAVELGLLA